MRRRQFVKSIGALGLAGLYSNTTVAEASAAPQSRGAQSQAAAPQPDDTEINDQIRREKFDTVLPEAMKKNNVDMWIYVMRETIPDLFGAQDLGVPQVYLCLQTAAAAESSVPFLGAAGELLLPQGHGR